MFRVLVVDDSSIDRFLIEALLRRQGDLEVRSAGDGAEALDCCRDERISVAVTDLRMPEMDGIEFTQQAAAEFPNMPVLLLVSVPGSEDLAVHAIQAGAAGFVVKDHAADSLPTLLDTVKTLLRQRTDGHAGGMPDSFSLRSESGFTHCREWLLQQTLNSAPKWTTAAGTRALAVTAGVLDCFESALRPSNDVADTVVRWDGGDSSACVAISGASQQKLLALQRELETSDVGEWMVQWRHGASLAKILGTWTFYQGGFSCEFRCEQNLAD